MRPYFEMSVCYHAHFHNFDGVNDNIHIVVQRINHVSNILKVYSVNRESVTVHSQAL